MAWRTLSSWFVLLLLASFAFGQVSSPGSPQTGVGSSTNKPTPADPPLPPDVKAPDAPPAPIADSSSNPVTRTLKRLAPNCINAVFHACWSSTPQRPQPPQTDERKGASSREVGEFYLERANYRAAESRFREALAYNPADTRAMFDLGQSLEKLDQADKAFQEYQSCVEVEPDGAYAPRCRKGLDRISSQASASRKP